MPHLELKELRKRFAGNQALDGVDVSLGQGELVSLLGPSGCGKTTALRCVAGFLQPDTGQIVIGGDDVTRRPPNRRDIGMVFQAYSLFPNMSAARQRRVRPQGATPEPRATQEARRRAARDRRPRARREAVPARALGRHAAARRTGTCAGDRAARAAARRAALGARRARPRAAARGDPARADAARDHDAVRDA